MPDEFRDPARRRLLDITDQAQADKGELATTLPDVDVPSQFDTPIQSTGLREDIMAGVQGRFEGNIANIQEAALQNRRFRAGSTGARELSAARASRNEAIGALGQVELQSQGQVLDALTSLATAETYGEQARATQEELLVFEQQKVDIMKGSLAVEEGKLAIDEQAFAESIRQFDVTTAEGKAQFEANLAETMRQFDLTQEQQEELAANALRESARQFNMADRTQRDLSANQIAESARQFNLSDETKRDLAGDQLRESARQYDMTDARSREQFGTEIEERARQFDLGQEQQAGLAADALSESSRQFDLTQSQDLDMHMDNIAEMARQFNMSFEQTRDLAANALAENSRQFDLANAQQADQFSQNILETARQFDMNAAQTRELAVMTMVSNEQLLASQLNVQHVGNMLDFIVEGAEALTAEDGSRIIDMAFEMSDIENNLNTPTQVTQLAGSVIASAQGNGPDAIALHNAMAQPEIWNGGVDLADFEPEIDDRIYRQLDFNGDGEVDATDYIIYRSSGGQIGLQPR